MTDPILTREANPPSMPVRIALAGWLMGGLVLIVDTIIRVGAATPALAGVAIITRLAIGFLLAVGSGLVLLSGRRWKARSTSWQLEMAGHPLLIAGWALFTAIVLLASGTLVLACFSLGFLGACTVRLPQVIHTARQTRAAVQHLPPAIRGDV